MILRPNSEEIVNLTFKQTGEIPVACERWDSVLSCVQRHGRNNERIPPHYFENVTNGESTRLVASVFRNHQSKLSIELVLHIVSKFHQRCGRYRHFMDETHSDTPTIFKTLPRNSRTPSGNVRPRASKSTIFSATGVSGRRTGSLAFHGSVGEP